MIITFEDNGRKITISDELSLAYDVLSMCKDGMLALGFHPESVDNAFLEMAEGLEENDKA